MVKVIAKEDCVSSPLLHGLMGFLCVCVRETGEEAVRIIRADNDEGLSRLGEGKKRNEQIRNYMEKETARFGDSLDMQSKSKGRVAKSSGVP